MIQTIEFRILGCFLVQNSRRFAEICRAVGLPTDLGGYYLRGLVKHGLLERSDRGTYVITAKGKHQLTIGYGQSPFIDRPRLCAMIVADQGDKFIALKRTRQPFIGVIEWPAGAATFGERLSDTVKRIAHDRLGLDSVTPRFKAMFRRIDMYRDTVFDDKLFAIYTLHLPANTTVGPGGITGRTAAYTANELRELKTPSKSLLDIFDMLAAGDTTLREAVYQLSRRDLFRDDEPVEPDYMKSISY